MRILKIKPHLSESELKKAMKSQTRIQDFQDYQIIYSVMVNQGKKASEISDILGVTRNKIYKTVEKYNKSGALWKANVRRGGRREERCIMSLPAEKEFLKSVEKDAVKGQIITCHQIKERLELQLNRRVSDDYI
jgi:transposase